MTELRPYQVRNVDQIEAKLAETERGTLYVAPTGSGKTVVFADIVRRHAERGECVMVEVHRHELMKQASGALTAAGVPHGLIDASHSLTSHRVHVTSIDTVVSRLGHLRPWLNTIDLYVRDEAHHSVSDNRQKVRQHAPRAKLLGPTATPYRADGAGLGDEFDNFVAAPDAATLTELGWLAPFRAYQPKAPRGLSFAGIRKAMGDYAAGQLAAMLMRKEVTDPVVRFHVEHAGQRPSIAFCVSVEHAKHVAERYQEVGGLNAVAIDGTMRRRRSSTYNGDQVDAALAGLADGSVDVVVSCQLIDEGLDVPRVACGVDFARTLSTGRLLQRIGRTRRPDDEYPDALWIDAFGNLREHGMPDEIRPWSLLSGVKNLERTVVRPMTCQRCRRVQPVGPLACIECGIPFVQHLPHAPAESAIPYAALSATLRAASKDFILTAPMKSLQAICETDADLRHVGQVRGYKPGWADRQIEFRDQMRRRFSGARRTG